MLAVSLGRELELGLAIRAINAVSRLLVFGVDVREPTDATAGLRLEVLAVVVQELVVPALVGDVGDRGAAVGLHAGRGDGRPAVLYGPWVS